MFEQGLLSKLKKFLTTISNGLMKSRFADGNDNTPNSHLLDFYTCGLVDIIIS